MNEDESRFSNSDDGFVCADEQNQSEQTQESTSEDVINEEMQVDNITPNKKTKKSSFLFQACLIVVLITAFATLIAILGSKHDLFKAEYKKNNNDYVLNLEEEKTNIEENPEITTEEEIEEQKVIEDSTREEGPNSSNDNSSSDISYSDSINNLHSSDGANVGQGENTVVHYSFIDNNFSAGDTLTRDEFAKWLCSISNISPNTNIVNPYSDVESSNKYYGYILALYRAHIMMGGVNSTTKNLEFGHDSKITRYEAIIAIMRAQEYSEMEKSTCDSIDYVDVPSNSSKYKTIQKATMLCLVKGTSTSQGVEFKPNEAATQKELVTVLSKAFNRDDSKYKRCDRIDTKDPFGGKYTGSQLKTYMEAYYRHNCYK